MVPRFSVVPSLDFHVQITRRKMVQDKTEDFEADQPYHVFAVHTLKTIRNSYDIND